MKFRLSICTEVGEIFESMKHLRDDLKFRSHTCNHFRDIEYCPSLSTTFRIYRHSITEILPDTDIVDNQSSWLIFIDSIHTSDCLHEIGSLHLLIDIHRMK